MTQKPISKVLSADLPVDWTNEDYISSDGEEVGLTVQHGYNYLNEQINEAQEGINILNDAIGDLNTQVSDIETSIVQLAPGALWIKAEDVVEAQNLSETNPDNIYYVTEGV